MTHEPYIELGAQTGTIPVQISYRIIELFSEGLYSSPNKAIEELVSNSFDAGANNVHVILSPDRTVEDAFIAVVDDGVGMDGAGLRQHWRIGESNKRDLSLPPKNRKQIGKFGIGKLATYVLATRLTHVSKHQGKYYATTMDYSHVPHGIGGGLHTEEKVEIPLRELTEAEAKEALAAIWNGTKLGYKAIKLFGPGSANNWTASIMSGLKDMARGIQKGRLSWVLRTAMPLRDDFKLFLDGEQQVPSKASEKPLQTWVLGKDLQKLPKPAPDDLEVTEDSTSLPEQRYGLTHPTLGRVTGYAEVYKDSLTAGKSDAIDRSNGFFVYVRGRLVNTDDALFGLPALRHGTFSKFRMVVQIDRLDDELRSTREAVRQGSLLNVAQNILWSVFNQARTWLKDHEESQTPGMKATGHIAQSPGSLTRRPLIGLVKSAFNGSATPKYLQYPSNLSVEAQQNFLSTLEQRAESDAGLVEKVELIDLSHDQGVALLDVERAILQVNAFHPFVAFHREDYEKGGETLSLLAMAEVLTEAYLYEIGLEERLVHDVISKRDELLRHFARFVKRNAYMVAQDLEDASTNKDKLEIELVAAFDSMGFDALRIGGSDKPDGRAVAHLGALDGVQRRYAVSLEAKSKEEIGKSVSAKTAGVAIVALHREEDGCEHAVIVGPEFPTSKGEQASLVKQIRLDRKYTGKTITLIRIQDLAKLVRLQPVKKIGLNRLRNLFETCQTTEESKSWIDALIEEHPEQPQYRAILETIWELQREVPAEAVEYGAITTSLRIKRGIVLRKQELINLCQAMSRIATQVVVREQSVELTQRPDKIIEEAGAVLRQFPEEEQKNSIFRF